MKTILATLFLLFLSNITIIGQDILVKNNGDLIPIEIIEINASYLIYKPYQSKSDTTIKVSINGLREINYESGEVYIFKDNPVRLKDKDLDSQYLYVKSNFFGPYIKSDVQRYKSKEILTLFEKYGNQESTLLYNKARTQSTVSNMVGLPSAFGLGFAFQDGFGGSNSTENLLILTASITGSIFAIITGVNARKNMRTAASRQNEVAGLAFSGTKNGIGLVYSF